MFFPIAPLTLSSCIHEVSSPLRGGSIWGSALVPVCIERSMSLTPGAIAPPWNTPNASTKSTVTHVPASITAHGEPPLRFPAASAHSRRSTPTVALCSTSIATGIRTVPPEPFPSRVTGIPPAAEATRASTGSFTLATRMCVREGSTLVTASRTASSTAPATPFSTTVEGSIVADPTPNSPPGPRATAIRVRVFPIETNTSVVTLLMRRRYAGKK